MTSFGARFCPFRGPFWQNLRLRRRPERSAPSAILIFRREKIDRIKCGSTIIFYDRRRQQPLLRIGDGPAGAPWRGPAWRGYVCGDSNTLRPRIWPHLRALLRYRVTRVSPSPHPFSARVLGVTQHQFLVASCAFSPSLGLGSYILYTVTSRD